MAGGLRVVQAENAFQDLNASMGDTPSGGKGSEPPDMTMNERLRALEAEVKGLTRVQDFTLLSVLGVGGILAAFIVGFGIYGLTRMDQLAEKTSAIPGQISAELRDTVRTLSEAITATKQQAPQVILLPAPPQQQAPQSPLPPLAPPK